MTPEEYADFIPGEGDGMNPTCIVVERKEAVAVVTLNRPDVHNAFDETLIADLTEAFAALSGEEAVRAIVVRGAGTSFCAGADLNWMRRMADYTQEENLEDARRAERMFSAIAQCPKVTIARVHGAAIGGGAGLAAACDIAIAVPEAVFAFSEVRFGIAPAVISPYVVQKIGLGAARGLFVTGERFRAEEALRLGLVQQVVPADELDAAVQKKVDAVLQSSPHAIAAAKQLLRDIAGRTPSEAAALTTTCIAALRVSPEGQEGLHAFLDKRKPGFAGTS
jgi:methylglutaconyl-CoA hydratase